MLAYLIPQNRFNGNDMLDALARCSGGAACVRLKARVVREVKVLSRHTLSGL